MTERHRKTIAFCECQCFSNQGSWSWSTFDPFYDTVVVELQSLVLTVVLIIGAVQLVNLQKSSLWLLGCGLSVSVIQTVLFIVAMVITLVVFMGVPEEIVAVDETLTNVEAVGVLAFVCIVIPLVLASLAFEIYALVWLYQNAANLPWRNEPPNRQGILS